MANFDLPSNNPVNEGGPAQVPWLTWFQRVHNVVIAQQQSGVTADRPTSGLYIGRRYYDETLNKPVYLRAIRPSVWRDAMGNIV
jgi:hypothetical protein